MSDDHPTTPVSSERDASNPDTLPGAGIRRRFVRTISTLVALVVASQLLGLVFVARPSLRKQIEGEAYRYAQIAAVPICDAFDRQSTDGESRFSDIIYDRAMFHPSLKAVAVTNPVGEVLFHSWEARPEEEGVPGWDAAPTASSSRDIETSRRRLGIDQLFEVRVPHLDVETGTLRYGVHFFFVYNLDILATVAMALMVGVAGLLVLGMGMLFARRLSAQILEPLETLEAGARRLGAGELGHRITLTTGDEIELLGNTLNRMAAHLETTIEELEASNERLNRLNEELKEIDRVKGDLLANVSHELRTPLTAISGYVEAMQEGLLGELDPTQTSGLEVVARNIRRLRGMIDQLLSYARMDSGQLEVELRPFELEPVARQVVEALTTIHGPEHEIRYETPPDRLPEIYGDASRIAQVIENLVTNALKFSLPGEPVVLRLEEVATGVEVTVADRGIGIPEEVRDKIFDRFYQVDASSKRKFGGMGLGLAIVREILELNHSEIRLDSRQGEGSTFRFVLPFASERTGMVPIQGRRRVALVDADAGYVQEMAAYLSKNGFVVDTAATTEQGYAMIRRVRPDAVLLDRMLPDGDGFDLLTRLAKDAETRNIPVVLVTARQEKALGLRLGAAEYLVKPVGPREVEKVLRRVTSGGSQGSRHAGDPGDDQTRGRVR